MDSELLKAINSLHKKVDDFRVEIEQRMDTNMTHYNERLEEFRQLLTAGFPDNDPAQHRKYHDRLIAEARRADEVTDKVKANVVGWGIIAILGASVIGLGKELLHALK